MKTTFDPDSLQRFILDRKGDRSYERISKDCGGVPHANRAQGLATKPFTTFPEAATIQGLARGLNASVTEVTLACAASVGLNVTKGPEPDALVLHGAKRLPQAAQDALVETSRQMQFLAGI